MLVYSCPGLKGLLVSTEHELIASLDTSAVVLAVHPAEH